MKRSLVPKYVSLSFQIIPILGWKLSQVPLLKTIENTFLRNKTMKLYLNKTTKLLTTKETKTMSSLYISNRVIMLFPFSFLDFKSVF